jgi:hypothetical protein
MPRPPASTSWRFDFLWPVFSSPSLAGFGCPLRPARGAPHEYAATSLVLEWATVKTCSSTAKSRSPGIGKRSQLNPRPDEEWWSMLSRGFHSDVSWSQSRTPSTTAEARVARTRDRGLRQGHLATPDCAGEGVLGDFVPALVGVKFGHPPVRPGSQADSTRRRLQLQTSGPGFSVIATLRGPGGVVSATAARAGAREVRLVRPLLLGDRLLQGAPVADPARQAQPVAQHHRQTRQRPRSAGRRLLHAHDSTGTSATSITRRRWAERRQWRTRSHRSRENRLGAGLTHPRPDTARHARLRERPVEPLIPRHPRWMRSHRFSTSRRAKAVRR